MKKNVLYKSIGLYTKKELEEIRKDYDCRDVVNGEYNDINEEDIQEYNDVEWNYSFGDEAEWKQSWVNEVPVKVIGNLGLWNGKKTIIPKSYSTIMEAINEVIRDMDEVEIYEDAWGNLKVDAYHHDGTNHFTIKKKTDRGDRCLNFSRMWNEYLHDTNKNSNLPF